MVQDWTNGAPDANWVHLADQNFWGAPKFFVRGEKALDLQILSRVDKTTKKLNYVIMNTAHLQ